ncbi:nicotinamide/nicotinic acid mononucleotide adenylyltransferase 1-like isoform X2 [Portunus trituberculatus]|uniref:nicotinamide/nicotinic acid mononucleotide adenylyltransferase 1-like isoform X2 n=1 Tax=Portunus trituberculatus TaxID=210409 RepID=UPI001E1CB94C|nr:nicotinamide/nicotinic acid mononucleotide adenylyltransferase 1-like isoform X2 [Portunus trituberculatus]
MTGSQRVVLLACGSFNPPTNMHLRMFEIARDFLHRTTNYHVVAGLMSPVHDKYGKEGLVNATDRVQMLRLALNSSAWVHVSEWETHQDDWTPTREVLQYHQELIDSMVNGNVDPTVKRQRVDGSTAWLTHLSGSTDTVTIKLLCGADLLESFARPGLWKDEDIEALVGKFGLVVITREGSNPYKFIYESDVLTRHQRNIHIVTEWITNEISSTKVRRALRRGDSVKYLVQDSVIDYIYKNALFDTHNKQARRLHVLGKELVGPCGLCEAAGTGTRVHACGGVNMDAVNIDTATVTTTTLQPSPTPPPSTLVT